ncbi:MAG: nitrogen regulation protein NR(I) [Pseudomonadota bacterium]
MSGTILVADDDAAIRTVVSQALTRAGFDVRATSNASTLWQWVAEGQGDAVISDVVMPDDNLFELLPRMKKMRPDLPFIVMSAQNTFMTAIRATEKGAYEYLPKPFDLVELTSLVGRALTESRRKEQSPAKPTSADGEMPLVGRSPAMQDIYRVLARMTQSDLTVLINGESGTGKELIARALHEYGKRKKGPFVAINMAAIPRDLIESELFGHEKGAFTGATARSSGRFEQAENGTLFLDEIGDMPMEAQTRLLRVLQQGEYMTVGGRTPIKTNVRIVTATNKDLRLLINQGLFREDLYYRLNVVPIRVPPLRERLEDIPDLATHFLGKVQEEGLEAKRLLPEALQMLTRYNWPGNVRELENLVRRLAALYPQEAVDADTVANELRASEEDRGSVSAAVQGAASAQPQTISEAVEMNMQKYFASFGDGLPPPGLYHRVLGELEYPLIVATLTATRGNQIRAAEVLGLNRNTLRKKIRDLNVSIFKA